MVRCLPNGRYSPGRESDCVSGVGRASRAVVPGGLPETGWLGSGGAGPGREPEIFTRRNDSGFTAADETAASCAEPDRRRRKPAFGGGRDHKLEECGMVPRWQTFTADRSGGGAAPAELRDGYRRGETASRAAR